MKHAQAPQRPFAQFVSDHEFLTILVVGIVLASGFIWYLSGTDGGTPGPSKACQHYAQLHDNYERLDRAGQASTGDVNLDAQVQDIIAQAKADCDASG